MKNTRRATKRVSIVGTRMCAGLGLYMLSGCASPEAQHSTESHIVVEPEDARQSMDGVLVSEENPLSLYTTRQGAGTAASDQPSSPGTNETGGDSGGRARDRAVSELGLGAQADPKICEPVRDAAVSYLAVPASSTNSYKALSRDNLTAVTVELTDSAEDARERVTENIELHGRCQDMTMTVSGVSVQTRVMPLDVDVDALQSSAAKVSGTVLGAPLKTVLVQASLGNAVVTVAHFDSDFLVTGDMNSQRMPAEDLEREATDVANEVLHNLREHAA
ncbi:hypothetical protein [Kocuria carniphila]|uniref:hypothetical protein n=1 Tax=Kocuria carniphila TaxID=262208 RepID=UPI00101CC33F|nr:hypothetical protein [Kocuria carniphila]